MTVPYIVPSHTVPIPRGLSVTQFLQTVFVGISNLPGPLVRPKWQKEPPKEPGDIDVNWMSLGIETAAPDANGYLGVDEEERTNSQRHETLEVSCSIYGADALDTYELIRDGLQIPQNLYALRSASMGIVEVGPARQVPDFVNERWIGRVQTSVFFRREIQRIYPILTILSASGTIHSITGNEEYLSHWEVGGD